MFDASQRHCELALAIDPQDPGLRTCGYAYLYAGKLSRVMHFLRLDEGSYPVLWGTVLYHLRLNESEAALRVARQAAPDPTRGLMEPCLQGARGAALDLPVAEFVGHWQRSEDPEAAFAMAPMLAYCGRNDEALQFLERAIDNECCSFPGLDEDPIWAPLRANGSLLPPRTGPHGRRLRQSVV